MKIKKVTSVGKRKVYDLSVADAEHYILENGVVTHNTGSYYSSDSIFIIGRQQEKDGTDLIGYNFIINVEKSRYVKEKSKIPVQITYEGGISKWSGLIDIALESGHVVKPSNGWYSKVSTDTGEVEEKKYRLKETFSADFWIPILKDKSFQEFVEKKYKVSNVKILTDDEIAQEFDNAGVDGESDE